MVFADDLNIFKLYSLDVSNEDVINDMQLTRSVAHKWGTRCRVTFAVEKEHIIVLYPEAGEGELIKFLRYIIDPKLSIQVAVDKLTSTLRPKIKAMFRMKGTYDL